MNMPRLSVTFVRASALIVMFLVSWLAVAWFKQGISAEGDIPTFDLAEIPLVLNEWSGEDVEIKDESVQVLNAHNHINRSYFRSDGRRVSLHIAIWINDGQISPAPHHPTVCYPAAGWSIINRSDTTMPLDGVEFPLELINFQKDGKGVVTGHWYELGNASFTNSEGFFQQRFKLMGSRNWPYSVKFLLQTDAGSIDQAAPILIEFAKLARQAFQELVESNNNSAVGSSNPPAT